MADLRSKLLTLDALSNLPALEPCIDGMFDLDSISMLYGVRGKYKSFVAIDMIASVNTGCRWHGHLVAQGPVIYVIGEGVGGLSARFDAWFEAHPNTSRRNDLYVLPEVVNLLSPSMAGEFAELAAELAPSLIVFDTLARMMVGGDENSSKDAGLAIEQLENIRRRTGAAVLVVHHAGKNAENGARGSSAFEAAFDTVLNVDADEMTVTIKATKVKNHAEPNPVRLHAVPTGDSIALHRRHVSADDLTTSALETLAALAEIQVPEGVSATAWRLSSGKPEGSFYRHRGGLVTLGLVDNVGSGKTPMYQVSQAGTLALSQDSHHAQR